MHIGGGPRSCARASRSVRALGLLLASAALVSACGTSGGGKGGDASSKGDASTTSTQAQTGAQIVPCADLDPMHWTAAGSEADLPFQIGAGEAPGLGGEPSGPPTTAAVFKTADEFLAQSNVPDPVARKQVMDDAGYRGGIEAVWGGDTAYKMQALTFASALDAATYVTARLPSICGQGGTEMGVTTFEAGDGIRWTDPLGATHGEFILGSSQVSLISCGDCPPVSLDEMQAWHDAYLDAYGTTAPWPIS